MKNASVVNRGGVHISDFWFGNENYNAIDLKFKPPKLPCIDFY